MEEKEESKPRLKSFLEILANSTIENKFELQICRLLRNYRLRKDKELTYTKQVKNYYKKQSDIICKRKTHNYKILVGSCKC